MIPYPIISSSHYLQDAVEEEQVVAGQLLVGQPSGMVALAVVVLQSGELVASERPAEV